MTKKWENNFFFEQSAISAFNMHFKLKKKRKSKNYCTSRTWSSLWRLTATLRLHLCSAMLEDLANKRAAARHGFSTDTAGCSSLPERHRNCFALCPSHRQSSTASYMIQRLLDSTRKAIITQTQTQLRKDRESKNQKKQTREENKKKKTIRKFQKPFF